MEKIVFFVCVSAFFYFCKKNKVMKRFLLFLLIYFTTLYGIGQPTIISPTFPSSVGLFDLFEVSFTMGDTYSNFFIFN